MRTPTWSRRDFLRLAAASSLGLGLAAPASRDALASRVSSHTARPQAQTVQVFDYDSTGSDLWVAADKNFETYFKQKYPNITVKRTTAPFTGFAERLLTTIAGGASFDCIYGYSAWLPQFVTNHAVQPLSKFLKQDNSVSESSFYDYGKDTHGGKVYGLAWYVGAQFPMYNKNQFKSAGVPDPADLDSKGKWTYDELQSIVSELTGTRNGQQVYGIDMSFTRIDSTYNAWARCWGTDVWSKNFKKSLLNSKQNIALWKYIQNFYAKKWTPVPSGNSGATDPFASQQTLINVTGPFYYRTAIQEGVPQKFDIGMTRNPKGAGGQTHVAGVNAYYMGNGSNPKGGWTWYSERSFSTKANALYLSVGSGRFPVRKSAKPATQYSFEDVGLYNKLRTEMFASPISPQESQFAKLFSSTWDNMALKNGSVSTLLNQLAEQADQQLQGGA